jgi:FkbM family methyltransferase
MPSLQTQPLGEKDEIKNDRIFKVWSQGIVDDKQFSFITLDTFVKTNNLKVDLIKIDVDSYDYEVLLGSKQVLMEQNPLVLVELNHALGKRNHHVQEALNFMDEIGYKLKFVLDNENYVFVKE